MVLIWGLLWRMRNKYWGSIDGTGFYLSTPGEAWPYLIVSVWWNCCRFHISAFFIHSLLSPSLLIYVVLGPLVNKVSFNGVKIEKRMQKTQIWLLRRWAQFETNTFKLIVDICQVVWLSATNFFHRQRLLNMPTLRQTGTLAQF